MMNDTNDRKDRSAGWYSLEIEYMTTMGKLIRREKHIEESDFGLCIDNIKELYDRENNCWDKVDGRYVTMSVETDPENDISEYDGIHDDRKTGIYLSVYAHDAYHVSRARLILSVRLSLEQAKILAKSIQLASKMASTKVSK